MSNTINSNIDYNSLFSSMPKASTGSAGDLTNLATEFSSIRSGSYKKLVSAYYKKMNTTDTSEKQKQEKTNLSLVAGNATSLKNAATELEKIDFSKDTSEDITKAVKSLVSAYNSVIDSADDVDQKGVLRNTLWMTNIVKKNEGLLNDVGLTIGTDNKLSFDETKWGKASMATKISLFNGNNSMSDKLAYKAGQINNTASTTVSNTASAYTGTGDYSKVSTDAMYKGIL